MTDRETTTRDTDWRREEVQQLREQLKLAIEALNAARAANRELRHVVSAYAEKYGKLVGPDD